MAIIEPTIDMTVTFKFICQLIFLSQVHILNFLLVISRMLQVFQNQFIVSAPYNLLLLL